MPRTNFTSDQKAQIFALDRATCSYSGRSLWICDYGLDPRYSIDWIDHVEPASLGGASTIANGVAACAVENYLRGNAKRRVLLFHRGIPTTDHTYHVGKLDPLILENLRRFRHLHPSDWYLNRAMWHVWISLTHEYERSRGARRSRGFDYYAKAALKMLSAWRRRADRDSVADIETRKLLPDQFEPDQQELLSVRDLATTAAIRRMMKSLYPQFEATAITMELLARCQRLSDIELIIEGLNETAPIPLRLRAAIGAYAHGLHSLMTEASELQDIGVWARDSARDPDNREEEE